MELALRHGLNPPQTPARAFVDDRDLPFRVLGGQPGYINILDALTAWPLVRELDRRFDLPAAASFKHVTPAGVALGLPLARDLAAACRVPAGGLSALACAYARARGADRQAAFGDFAALSRVVDDAAADLLAREVSDGVIAPGYAPSALARLRAKKGGRYLVLQIDAEWAPPSSERREVFGVTLEQPRDSTAITIGEVVTANRALDEAAARDLTVAAVTLRYTPSNSVCVAHEGQVVGVGAGQQSRIHCTRLACTRADTWWLRRHPRALALRFAPGTPRPARDNAVDAWLEGDVPDALVEPPPALSGEERQAWLSARDGLALASDGYIPFGDNVDRAARSGVRYIWQPGGSARDAEVIAAADALGLVMSFSGQRLFLH